MPTMPHMATRIRLRSDAAADGRATRRPLADVRFGRPVVPQRSRTTAASCSAVASATRGVGASTITRTSGSVPLGRTSTRPVVAELGLDGGDLGGDAVGGVGHRVRSPAR